MRRRTSSSPRPEERPHVARHPRSTRGIRAMAGAHIGLTPAGRLRLGVAEARGGRRARQHEADRNQQAIERKTDHRRGSGGARVAGSARLWGRHANRDHLAADRIEDGDGHRGCSCAGLNLSARLTPMAAMVSAPCSDVVSPSLRLICRLVPPPHQGRKRSEAGLPASMNAIAPTTPASATKTSAPNMLPPQPDTGELRLEHR